MPRASAFGRQPDVGPHGVSGRGVLVEHLELGNGCSAVCPAAGRAVSASASNRDGTKHRTDDAEVVDLDFVDTVRPLIPRWWSALRDDLRAVPGTSAGMGRLVVRSTGSTWALSTSHPAFARTDLSYPGRLVCREVWSA